MPQGATVRFVVPWRPDGAERDRLWAWCREWWRVEMPGVVPHESSSPDGPFNRAAAINAGAAGDWDVLVVADADVICPGSQLRLAITRALRHDMLVFPFQRFVGLNQAMTDRVLGGYGGRWDTGARFRSDRHVSSILVLPRKVWGASGGFDERFRGWGCEDVEFARRVHSLRVPGSVFHLWHPNPPDKRRGDSYRANRALLKGER